MKSLKAVGLSAVAAMALLAFVGNASATELYGGVGTLGWGSTLDLSLKSGTSASITDTEGNSLDTCTGSTFNATITNAGSSSTTTEASPSELTWSSCTFPTKTVGIMLSGLEVHYTSGINGTVTNSKADIEVTINTVFFGSCIYSLQTFTDVGVLTGSNSLATPATLDVNAVVKKATGSNFACPLTAKWVASYSVTSPSKLEVRAS